MEFSSFAGILGSLGNAFKGMRSSWKALGVGKQRLVIVICAAIFIIAGFSIWMLNMTRYGILYTNLSANEAGQILARLDESGIPAKVDGSDTILVDVNRIDKVRMELAAEGLPRNELNLNILEKGSGFGITEDDKKVYRRYQLQQDLQNAIKTFSSVSNAVVSLTLPEKSVFLIEDQSSKASAAVLLTLKPGTSLSEGNVHAIAELVRNSVPDIQDDSISIIDNNMNVLNARGGGDEAIAADHQRMQAEVSDRLQRQILNLLQPVFGIGKVLTEVNVTLDFDESSVESIRFEPSEGSSDGIVASIDSLRETAFGNQGVSGVPGTGENGSSVTYESGDDEENRAYDKSSESIVYEINTIKEYLVKSKGAVKSMSVSVLLDNRDGAATEYRDTVRNLVSSAIGVSADTITVETLPFNGSALLDDSLEDYNRINDKAVQWERTRFFLILGAIVIVLMTAMFLLVRTLRGGSAHERDILEELPAGTTQAALRAFSSKALELAPGRLEIENPHSEVEEEKRVIEQYIDTNPELVANILRTWLAEEVR
ncbi:MAG: flagellar M-ring protein FliF [Clostridiaceae bacterium]|nr:flagellar M-ring protein FliF [Clostridiaceae bacterium]